MILKIGKQLRLKVSLMVLFNGHINFLLLVHGRGQMPHYS